MKRGKRKKGSRKHGLVGLSLMVAAFLPRASLRAQTISTCFQTLSFGSMVTCPGGGTITVEPTGVRSSTGCIVVTGNANAGACFIKGSLSPVRPIQVSVAAATYPISNGTDQMNIDNFNLNAPGNGPQVTTSAFFVPVFLGGRLTVPAGTGAGTYTGTVTINANFQ
jgi:hypothetical protein